MGIWEVRTIPKDEQIGKPYKVGVEVDTSSLEKTNELLDGLNEKAGKLVALLTEAETILARLTRPGINP